MIPKTQTDQPQTGPSGSPLSESDEIQVCADFVRMTPAQIQKSNDDADAIRIKLEKRAITEADIADAVKWARANSATDGA